MRWVIEMRNGRAIPVWWARRREAERAVHRFGFCGSDYGVMVRRKRPDDLVWRRSRSELSWTDAAYLHERAWKRGASPEATRATRRNGGSS